MRLLVIGGFLGSGKTTTVLRVGKYLSGKGMKVAIIVNEIGEIGVDGDVISRYGFDTTELTNGCICCSLKRDLRYTVNTLCNTYKPDVLLIEPTGIAFPHIIKNDVMLMNLSDVTFAPLVTLIDGSRFKYLMKEVKHFSERQIVDADIIIINKIDLVDHIRLPIIESSAHQLNPGAKVISLSAHGNDADFQNFMDLVLSDAISNDTAIKEIRSDTDVDSIACSGVSNYATEFILHMDHRDITFTESLAKHLMEVMCEDVIKYSPEFVGHIKLFLDSGSAVTKASVTAYYESPILETIESEHGTPTLKILTAVTGISKDDLVEIVNRNVCDVFDNKVGVGLVTYVHENGYSHNDECCHT
ncbi:MAG: GTP-binding protein [Methanosarcinaceae archaeon]|nr:GTP-binding protein [Methanosarcinaceae archaeon]